MVVIFLSCHNYINIWLLILGHKLIFGESSTCTCWNSLLLRTNTFTKWLKRREKLDDYWGAQVIQYLHVRVPKTPVDFASNFYDTLLKFGRGWCPFHFSRPPLVGKTWARSLDEKVPLQDDNIVLWCLWTQLREDHIIETKVRVDKFLFVLVNLYLHSLRIHYFV